MIRPRLKWRWRISVFYILLELCRGIRFSNRTIPSSSSWIELTWLQGHWNTLRTVGTRRCYMVHGPVRWCYEHVVSCLVGSGCVSSDAGWHDPGIWLTLVLLLCCLFWVLTSLNPTDHGVFDVDWYVYFAYQNWCIIISSTKKVTDDKDMWPYVPLRSVNGWSVAVLLYSFALCQGRAKLKGFIANKHQSSICFST